MKKTAQRNRRIGEMTGPPHIGRGSVVATTGLLCAVLWGAALATNDSSISLKLDDLGRGMYRLEGRIDVEVPQRVAWEVLTDYEHIGTFVSSLRRSRIAGTSNGMVLLEQEALGRLLFFSRTIHVTLKVYEKPFTRIAFEDISKKDFTYYTGLWQLDETSQGTRIVYRLDCQRRFFAPNMIARDVLQKNAFGLLRAVRDEMLRRSRA